MDNKILIDIGKRFRDIRENVLNLTQKELAQELEVKQSVISGIENGMPVNILKIIDLCDYSKITLKEFFNFDDEDLILTDDLKLLLDKAKKLKSAQISKLIEFIEIMHK